MHDIHRNRLCGGHPPERIPSEISKNQALGGFARGVVEVVLHGPLGDGDRYVKQLSALGFTGFDTFFFYLHMLAGMYGSVPGFERFLQDNGFEKITGIFSA